MKTLVSQPLKLLYFFIFICAPFLSLAGTHPSILKEEFVFHKPPFASCHASTLTETPSGNILCAFFGGTEEGDPDVAIWLTTLSKEKWSSPKKVAAIQGVPCWNPVLFTMPSNEILLFYKVGRNPQQWSGFLKTSSNDGVDFSEALAFPAGIIGPVKNKPLLVDGTLLCGSSIESWRCWGCFVDMTSDMGHSWTKSNPINVEDQLFGIIQPTLFFGKKDTIKLLARSHQIGSICTSESTDHGKTWSAATPIDLPNPNSAIDAVNLTDGRIVLIYNHSKEDRYPLNLAISKDGGNTWTMEVVLEDKPGEYSYPSVIQTSDENIHITYTWNRTNIKHVIIDPKHL